MQKLDEILEKIREESFLKDIPENILTDIEAKVNRRSDEIDEKIRFITENNLMPSIKTMMRWMDGRLTPQMRLEVGETVQAMSEAIDTLKPVVEIHESNLRKLSRKVCLVTEDKKIETLCKLAFGGSGVQFSVISKNNPSDNLVPQILLIDYQCREQHDMLAQRFPDCEVVFVIDVEILHMISALKNFGRVKYFTTYDKANRAFSIRSIATTVKKILQKDFFGMEKYLMWGTHIETRSLTCSDDRLQLIEDLESVSRQNGVRSSILDRAHTVTEELLMNSVYAAPRGPDGKFLYNHLQRDVRVDLSVEQQPEFKYATDGTILAVSVSDPFGSLSKETIQMYLQSGHEDQIGIHNDDKGGAGRGLHMIVETSDFTVFNIKEGSRTEIICFFNLENSESKESKSAINIFQI